MKKNNSARTDFAFIDFGKFFEEDIIIGIIPQDGFKDEEYLVSFKNWAVAHNFEPGIISITDTDYYKHYPEYVELHSNTWLNSSRLALISIADLMYVNERKIRSFMSRNIPITGALTDCEMYILSDDSSTLIAKFRKNNYKFENIDSGYNVRMIQTFVLQQNITAFNAITIHKKHMDVNKLSVMQFNRIIGDVAAIRHEITANEAKRIDADKKCQRKNEIPLSQILEDKILKQKDKKFTREI